MYSLYIHINKINHKKYVGITNQQNINNRWKNGLGYNKSPRFFNAIIKYGWDNFNHIVLFNNLTKEEAETLEKYYISLYQTTDENYGYNIQKGGGITNLSELTKFKIRISTLGKKHSLETKLKMSKSHIGKQKCLGYKHSEETKEKHRKAMLGINNIRAKSVNQYSLDGKYIKTYDYMEQIKCDLNIKSTSHISQCCMGKRNKCYGYIWKYSNISGGDIDGSKY